MAKRTEVEKAVVERAKTTAKSRKAKRPPEHPVIENDGFPSGVFRCELAKAAELAVNNVVAPSQARALVAIVKEATPRDIEAQVRNVGLVDREMEVDIALAKGEVAQATHALRLLQAQRAFVRTFIRDEMVRTERKSLKIPGLSLSVSDGRMSVDVFDEEALPEELTKVKRVPDKKAISRYIEDTGGTCPPGAQMKQGDPILTIRFS